MTYFYNLGYLAISFEYAMGQGNFGKFNVSALNLKGQPVTEVVAKLKSLTEPISLSYSMIRWPLIYRIFDG